MKTFLLIFKIFFVKNFFFTNQELNKIKLSFFLFLILSILELLSISMLVVIVLNTIGENNQLINKYFSFLQIYEKKNILIMFIFFISVKYLLQVFLHYYEKKILKNLQINYSIDLLKCYLYTSNNKTLELNHSIIINNLISEVKNVFIGFFRPANEFFSECFITCLILILLVFLAGYQFLFIFILAMFLIVIFVKIISKIANKWGGRRILAGVELNSTLRGIFSNYFLIKLLNKENFFLKKILPNYNVVTHAEFIEDLGQKLFRVFLEIFIFIFLLIFLLILSFKNSELIVSQMITIFIPAMRMLPSLSKINTCLNKMLYSFPAALNLQKTKKELLGNQISSDQDQKKINFEKQIEINNLSFFYTKNQIIFENKNFIFKKNLKYLIRGKSGSGKTTFIELLLGFKKPSTGSYKIDGVNYEPKLSGAWIKLFGYVPQEIFLLNENIKNNIAFGEKDDSIDVKKVNEILEIMNLKNTFSLNYEIQNFGSNISGGQKQRIGICRALYFDPQILILDEPTSQLSIEDSQKIMEDILKLNKTVIVVSHDENIFSKFKNVINF